MNRETFFSEAQKLLVNTKSWSEFVKEANAIKSKQEQFSIPASMYTNYESVSEDKISRQLLPNDAHPQLIPMQSYGDGNCLFRSISLIVFGHENYHTELRVRTIIELTFNEELYLKEKTFSEMAEYSHDGILEYIIEVSVSDGSYVPNNRKESLRNEIMHSAKRDTYASMLHTMALCNVIKKPINSIHPMVQNPSIDRDVHNQVLFPIGEIYYSDSLSDILTILWTHTSDTNLVGWKPNHFVPCFPVNEYR